jgi:regulator of sigma E protease
MPKSPAEHAGLQPGDQIAMIDGRQVSTWDAVAASIHGKGTRPVTLLIERKGQDFSLVISPQYDPSSKSSLIGIVPTTAWLKQGIVPGMQSGLEESYGWSAQILQTLAQLFTGKVQVQDLSGPVGIVKTLGDTAREGLRYLLMLTGVLGINLAIVNLLPIPALDGSRLVFLLLEGVRGKPINPEKENIIHLVGFAVLMCLVLLITYNDILRLFNG